jgi:hypothetical protein
MFETLMARAMRAAERRARERARALAGELDAALPNEIRAEARADGVLIAGRALRRRRTLDPALRWTLAGRIR